MFEQEKINNLNDSAAPLSHLIAETLNNVRKETLKFKTMVDRCPIPAWMSDHEGKILYVNEAYTNLTGFAIEDLQKEGNESIYIEDKERILKSWDDYSLNPDNQTVAWHQPIRILRKDKYPIRCNITAIRVNNNGYIGFTYPATITPDLLLFDTPLQRFFELASDLLVISDTENCFVRCSNSWIKDFGYTFEELYNKKYYEFIHPDDIEKTKETVERIYSGSIINFSNRYFNKITQKYHTINWNASEYQNGFTYAIGRDITTNPT